MTQQSIPDTSITNTVMTSMSADEARQITDRIRNTAEALHALLLEAHERRAWEAMGYPSWRAYAKCEFNMGQSHAYRLLDQGRVIKALAEATNSPIGETLINESTARQIKPQLALVTAKVRERLDAGDEPEKAITHSVGKVLEGDNTTKLDRYEGLSPVQMARLMERERRYLTSRHRADRPNRFIVNTTNTMESLADNLADFQQAEFDLIDIDLAPRWAAALKRDARRLLAFAARLEREVSQ